MIESTKALIIFDVDGTLIDSCEYDTKCYIAAGALEVWQDFRPLAQCLEALRALVLPASK